MLCAEYQQEVETYKEELTLTASRLSNKQINRAGEVLSSGITGSDAEEAYAIVNEWRASYSFPLRAITTVLKKNAIAVNRHALISGRLKRMESIVVKLQRQSHMELMRMNDIGGCRAVLWGISEVSATVDRLKTFFVENGPFKPKYYDYIKNPKPDGYRGIHIAVQYQSKNPAYAEWSGRRIEMQIRSTLQHAWATAVETVDLFAGESLKIGQGNVRWTRFFALASATFAKQENSYLVPETPEGPELLEELRSLWDELRVLDQLGGWTTAMTKIPNSIEGANYLIVVDSRGKIVTIVPFGPSHIAEANAAYAAAEKEARSNLDRNAVLVSVDKITDLQNAFPNYYADTAYFLRQLRMELND